MIFQRMLLHRSPACYELPNPETIWWHVGPITEITGFNAKSRYGWKNSHFNVQQTEMASCVYCIVNILNQSHIHRRPRSSLWLEPNWNKDVCTVNEVCYHFISIMTYMWITSHCWHIWQMFGMVLDNTILIWHPHYVMMLFSIFFYCLAVI